jgi:hypothetical protein
VLKKNEEVIGKETVNLSLGRFIKLRVMNTYGGVEVIAPLFGTIWKLVVTFTPLPIYPRGNIDR